MAFNPTPPNLLSLPPEIHLQIASHLSYPYATLLRLTCKQLYVAIPWINPAGSYIWFLYPDDEKEFLVRFRKENSLVTCFICSKFLHPSRSCQGGEREDRIFKIQHARIVGHCRRHCVMPEGWEELRGREKEEMRRYRETNHDEESSDYSEDDSLEDEDEDSSGDDIDASSSAEDRDDGSVGRD